MQRLYSAKKKQGHNSIVAPLRLLNRSSMVIHDHYPAAPYRQTYLTSCPLRRDCVLPLRSDRYRRCPHHPCTRRSTPHRRPLSHRLDVGSCPEITLCFLEAKPLLLKTLRTADAQHIDQAFSRKERTGSGLTNSMPLELEEERGEILWRWGSSLRR
jgi:hypothetical protein